MQFRRPKSFRYYRITFLFFIFCTLIAIFLFSQYAHPLHSKLQMAKTTEEAAKIVARWKESGQDQNRLDSLKLDYIFIFFYTVTLFAGCRVLSVLTKNDTLVKAGGIFSYIIVFAALCDIVENITMSRMLHGKIDSVTAYLAYVMAGIKFSGIILVLIFTTACFLIWVVDKFQKIQKVKS